VNRHVDTGYDPLQGGGDGWGFFGPKREAHCPFLLISASFHEYFNAKNVPSPLSTSLHVNVQ